MGKRVSVFIVEDNCLYTYFLNEALKDETNVNITTFETAQQCIESLGNKPDLIVMDYYLEKGVTGLDAFKVIHNQNPKLPVIVLSGQDNVQVAADLLEAGVCEYIEKKDRNVIDKLKKIILEIANNKDFYGFKYSGQKRVNNKSIFIIEDNPTYARALELYLKHTFSDLNEVRTFPVGEVALLELDHEPGVIIMDYFLDGRYYDAETGLEAIKYIKYKKPQTQIILLSSQGEINVALEATQKYNCHYIKKDYQAFNKVENFIREVWF